MSTRIDWCEPAHTVTPHTREERTSDKVRNSQTRIAIAELSLERDLLVVLYASTPAHDRSRVRQLLEEKAETVRTLQASIPSAHEYFR